jgi:hypothetical protein
MLPAVLHLPAIALHARTGERSGPGTIRADRPARAKPAGKKFSR